MESQRDCITLDYLELFCESKQLVVGCKTNSEEEVWISALGPHPSGLTADEISRIIGESSFFELRTMHSDEEEIEDNSLYLTRPEMDQRLRKLLN